jgi:hypothetical protein
MTAPFDPIAERAEVCRAVESFRRAPLDAVEALIAATEIAAWAAARFHAEAQQLRAELGDGPARELATTQIAEAIARLQDAAAPAVHGYNQLLRDSDDGLVPTVDS